MLKSQKGFTLIELVMIIVILGILAAVAVPRYVDMSTSARTAAFAGGKGAVKAAWGIQIASLRTYPSVTALAHAVDGGTPATDGVTIQNITKSTGSLYKYKTYTDAECASATTAITDTVLCIKCESEDSEGDCSE